MMLDWSFPSLGAHVTLPVTIVLAGGVFYLLA